MITKFRDLTLIKIEDRYMTAACDSCSGVGQLSSDIVKADGFYTGFRTAIVPLIETIAAGGKPLLIINTLSVSIEGYGQEIIRGITKAAKNAGLTGNSIVTGSTEENFIVPVTSMGITVIGTMLKPPSQKLTAPCNLYLVGKPVSGRQVLECKNEILSLSSVLEAHASQNVIDILPVGSKGISYELNEMTETLCAGFTPTALDDIDINASAGPATCALVACTGTFSISDEKIPITKLGMLYPA